jgi:TRAP transporter TAXI family solute receptor
MKKFLSVILAAFVALSVVSCAFAAQGAAEAPLKAARLVLGSSVVSSTYYIMATGWSNLIHKKLPQIEISVEATPGGITNMQSMRQGDMDLGMTTSWLAGDGKEGTNWANGTKYDNCLSIFPTHNSVMYIYTLAENGINSIHDLEGKNIACGNPGSTSGDAVPLLLKSLGITPKNISYLNATGMSDALKDGTIDVAFGVTGIPAAWMLDLESTKDVKIIPLDEEYMEKILKQQPYWGSGVIPAGTYKNQPKDIPVIAFWNMIVANDSLSDDLIYARCKLTYENIDELAKIDPNFKTIAYENLSTMTMPLHPGALKYYTDQGVTVPDALKK